MKIINIIQRYSPAVGGSETWCQEVCRYLASKGHSVSVLTLNINEEEEYWCDPSDDKRTIALGRLAFDNGIIVRRFKRSLPIHSLYHWVYKRILDQFCGIYFYGPHSGEMYGHMWREMRAADVVFLHTLPHPHNLVAFIIAKLLRKKIAIVPHLHPTHPHYERRSLYWLMKHCDVVITVTEFEKKYLIRKGVPPENLHITGNGIHADLYCPTDLDAFRSRLVARYSLRPDDRVVTFIGRKIPEKGVHHLITAVKNLLEDIPVKLFLAGPSSDWYQNLYANLSEHDKKRIIDLGVLSHRDKVHLLHVSHLLALPSRYEAFGIVFLEAWICGASVLGTHEGAIPSVIGDDGFLCQFGDVKDLQITIKTALRDTKILEAMGERGKAKTLEYYTWDMVGKKAEAAVRVATHKEKKRLLKILIATNAYPPRSIGGAELVAHAYAKQLKKLGHEVAVFAGEFNGHGQRYSTRHDSYEGIPVTRVCLHSQDYSSEFFNFYHEPLHHLFEKMLDAFSPDIIHFHNIIGLSVNLVQVAKRKRLKTVMTLHDHWGFCLKNTLIKAEDNICTDFSQCIECMPVVSELPWRNIPIRMRSDFLALQLQKVDVFISPSNYLAKTYIRAGFCEEKIRIIWYGIDVKRFAGISRSVNNTKVRFSFVGYLGRHKGIHTLFEALQLLGMPEKIMLNLVGDGPERAHYEEQIRKRGWEGSVRFWGHVENNRIEQVYQETDVLILPSIWPENQPVSITEAMAARIPVIASRLGGIPELVEEGQTGYLFEAGNAQELAHKMLLCISNKSQLQDFGERALQKIAASTIECQMEKILAVYQEDSQGPTTTVALADPLLVCQGKNMDTECAQALGIFLRESPQQWRVVMCDWLTEEQTKHALVLWVVDKKMSTKDVLIGLRNQLPLLVPEKNSELKDLCVYGRCGLYYRDIDDAVGCLSYLSQNQATREILGKNGLRLFYS